MSLIFGHRLRSWSFFIGGVVACAVAYISFRRHRQKVNETKRDKNVDSKNSLPTNESIILLEKVNENYNDKIADENMTFSWGGNTSGEVSCNKEWDGECDTTNISQDNKVDENLTRQETELSSTPREEESEKDILSSYQESKSKTQKSKIPHYSHEKSRVVSDGAKRNTPKHYNVHSDVPLSSHKNSPKQSRLGNMSLMKTDDEDDLKRKYKSLFRSKQSDPKSPIYSGSIYSDRHDKKEPCEDTGSNDLGISKQDSLITDEDGSNLLVESGFFDNDLKTLDELSTSECSEKLAHSAEAASLILEPGSKEKETNFFQEDRDRCSDEALFKEAEEELIMNLAIQDTDIKLLLETISKSESVSLLARGFQALVDFSNDKSIQEVFLQSLSFIYSSLDVESDAVKVEVLKVLLNLSKNVQILPHLLSANAPDSLLKYFLLDIDEEIQLTWLAFVFNIFDYWKKNKSILQASEISKKEDSVYGVLFGIRSSRIIRSRVYLLTRHRNRHISQAAKQIYADMSSRDATY